MVGVVHLRVLLLVAGEAGVCVRHAVVKAGLLVGVWRGQGRGLVLVVARLVEGLRMPPVVGGLQGLHGAGGSVAVVEGVAAASLVCVMVVVVVVVPVALSVTLTHSLL